MCLFCSAYMIVFNSCPVLIMAFCENSFSMKDFSIEKVLSESSTLVFNKNRRLQVIKSLKCSTVHIDEIKSRLESLVKLAHHPDLVKVEEVFEDVDTIYVTFTYCEGGSLSALLKRAKHYDEVLNESELLDWFIQIASCLEHFHSRGIAYGLLNPNNILLHNNACKLSSSEVISSQFSEMMSRLDDVEAASIRSSSDSNNVQFGSVVCRNRAPYLSPLLRSAEGCEQVPTPADDMWALGCILCEMCTLQKTFSKNCLQSTVSAPAFPDQYSPDLNDIAKRLLEENPENRLNAADLLSMDVLVRHRQESQLAMTPENDLCLTREEYLLAAGINHKDDRMIAACVDYEDCDLDNESAYLTSEDICTLLASF